MNPATKNLIGAIFVGAAFFLFWTFNYTTWGQIPIYRDEIATRQATLDERRKTLDDLKKYGEEYRKRADEIKRFGLIIPTKKDIEYALSAMAVMADESSVQIKELSLAEDKAPEGTGMGTVDINASLTGNLDGFLTFMKNLEKNIRLMDAQVVTVLRNGTGTLLDFNVKIKTYIAK